MEKKIRKVEIPVKATDSKPRDRGDNLRASRRVVKVPNNRKKVDNETQVNQEYLGDRGDGGKKTGYQAKFNNHRLAKPEIGFGINLSGKNIRKIYEKMNRENETKPLNFGRRKELLETYTFRKTVLKGEIAAKGEPISEHLDALAGELKSEKPLLVMREEAPSGKMYFNKHMRALVANIPHTESTPRPKKKDQILKSTEGRKMKALASLETQIPVYEKKDQTQKSVEGRKMKALASPEMQILMYAKKDQTQKSVEGRKMKALASPEMQIPMYENEPSELPKTITRKPIIKTVTNKNDSSKIYKAVSFGEQKKKTVPLRISINKSSSPSYDSRSSRQKSKQTLPESLESFKSKTDILKAKKKVRTTTSPCSVNKLMIKLKANNKSRRKRVTSPEQAVPTHTSEVAQWAPMSVNTHTKPYYEAWVNTTLAAISRNTDEKLYKEKQEIIRHMQKAIENSPPPEDDDFSDERYTGRIRVHHR